MEPKKIRRVKGRPWVRAVRKDRRDAGLGKVRYRIPEIEITEEVEGVEVPIRVSIPPEIEIVGGGLHDPKIGVRDSARAKEILKDMPRVRIPFEYYYTKKGKTAKRAVEVKGETLHTVVAALMYNKPTQFSVRDVYKAFSLLKKAVNKLHNAPEPVYHGDINPTNVLVAKNEKGKIEIGLIDWGFGVKSRSQDIGCLKGIASAIKDMKKERRQRH